LHVATEKASKEQKKTQKRRRRRRRRKKKRLQCFLPGGLTDYGFLFASYFCALPFSIFLIVQKNPFHSPFISSATAPPPPAKSITPQLLSDFPSN
jgi:hypothetical protein